MTESKGRRCCSCNGRPNELVRSESLTLKTRFPRYRWNSSNRLDLQFQPEGNRFVLCLRFRWPTRDCLPVHYVISLASCGNLDGDLSAPRKTAARTFVANDYPGSTWKRKPWGISLFHKIRIWRYEMIISSKSMMYGKVYFENEKNMIARQG